MENKRKRIEIDVSGTKFCVSSDILIEKPFTRLGRMASKLVKDTNEETTDSFQFDRPIPSFQAVLEYYQTGQLHMPLNTCPKSFQNELEFWEIDPGEMEKCCLYQYITFMDDFETLYTFQTSLQKEREQTDTRLKSKKSSCKHVSARLWAILDNKESSLLAKAYLVVALVFVLLSVLSLALSTLPVFDQTLSACELREYMDYFEGFDDQSKKFLEKIDCLSDPYMELERVRNEYDAKNVSENDMGHDDYDDDFRQINPRKVNLPTTITKRNDKFTSFEYTVITFFTIELILRLMSCPSLKKYFMSVLNIIEIIVLLASYVSIVLENTYRKVRYTDKGLQILQFFQIFRIFRLLRVMQNVAAMRVLTYSVRSGYKDLILVFLYLFSGIVMFGNFLYFVESTKDFPSIPDAWWWGVITMTTVGYGDMVPKSVAGKLIASLCAISGVLLLSLMIPIFVNTFMSLYKFAHLHEKHENLKSRENNDNSDNKVSEMDKNMTAREKLYSFQVDNAIPPKEKLYTIQPI